MQIWWHASLGKIRSEHVVGNKPLSKLLSRSLAILKIFRQINSLHQEMIAQRALDRKLTSELTQFKQSIHELTQGTLIIILSVQ